MKHKYIVEKLVTAEYIVFVSEEEEGIKEVVAKCNSEGAASTIAGMYNEKEESDSKQE